MPVLFGSQTAVRRALGLAETGHPADALASAVRQRESALNRERVLRSAVEETLRECSPHAGATVSWVVLADRLDRIQSICQGALDATEASS